ncbi:4-hydroxybutyrate coenzyme A transferase [Fasciolopsis buskii]|uniref:4-hydroxybutyrate coenzyme A transferase n=1 Tax=Fasciolopsis buskii TaxID=27845 RepID=A0A8E0VJP6_9TREM|nr:4-hydroxybutyrate coenzyme A transferase [Fasciolopsis buski]
MIRLTRCLCPKPTVLSQCFPRKMYIGDPGKLELDKRSEPFSPIPSVSPKWGKAEDAFKSLKDGQVNPNVPETGGDANIHSSHFDYLVYGTQPLHEMEQVEPNLDEIKVGRIISEELVEDGCTIEAGIGSIPQSVYRQLTNHQNLGIHTEMFSDSLVDLASLGIITNAYKTIRPGKVVASFVVGTRKAFDFVDNNPLVDMCDIEWVAAPETIARNPKPTSINTCLAIDLTGQVTCDSIGNYIYSGVGGIVDFMRGAAISVDGKGKPILGITSRTRKGEPKIVPMLKPATGVVITRAHVHYVVTEYGIAYLFGRNLRQRAYSLIQIAHPDDRYARPNLSHTIPNNENLERAAYENLKTMPSPD